MSVSLANAPLIEIIADVRWAVIGDDVEDAASGEEFYSAMAREFARIGFSQSERLSPDAYEARQGDVLYKYLNPNDSDTTVVYQLSHESFSVNAIPPYKTWSDFKPALEAGIDILLSALAKHYGDVSLTRVRLNYVDAFDETHLDPEARYEFMKSTLNLGLSIPDAIQKRLKGGALSSAFMRFGGETLDGDRIFVQAGLASISNAPVVILDTTVSHRQGVEPKLDAVLAVLERAHGAIHDIFVEMTMPIADILKGGKR